jgi:xanthine dehydrogenase accessory factor
MNEIYTKLRELIEQRQPVALVTVIATTGSTPRETGTKMLVRPDGSIYGTVGGSSVEAKVIAASIKSLREGKCLKISHNLDDEIQHDTGMICGGTMEFFIEPLNAAPLLYIFGAGHVALPLARLASQVGFDYIIIEDRTEFATRERFPEARKILTGNPDELAGQINFSSEDYIAIVSRSHEIDFQVLRRVIVKPFHYLGLIGSKKKRQQIFNRLKEEGISAEQINTIHTPIGLEIGAESPQEIAVSIVAELIKIKNT